MIVAPLPDEEVVAPRIKVRPISNNLLAYDNFVNDYAVCLSCARTAQIASREVMTPRTIFTLSSTTLRCWQCTRYIPGRNFGGAALSHGRIIEFGHNIIGRRATAQAQEDAILWLANRIPYSWIDSVIENYPNIPFAFQWALRTLFHNIRRAGATGIIAWRSFDINMRRHQDLLGAGQIDLIKDVNTVECIKKYTRMIDILASNILGESAQGVITLDCPHQTPHAPFVTETTPPPSYELI